MQKAINDAFVFKPDRFEVVSAELNYTCLLCEWWEVGGGTWEVGIVETLVILHGGGR